MTAKSRVKPEDSEPNIQSTEEQSVVALVGEQGQRCGKPHHLPLLADITCTEPVEDLEPGAPEHEHRHEDGETLYVWR